MSLTNFPNGLSSFGIPLLGSGPGLTTTGKVYFVHSSTGQDANGKGSSPSDPFATIDFAVGKCRAAKGDIIVAMPGHVETVTAAGGLDLDVEGITVYGLGSGVNRPRVNFTTAVGADMDVDAANITVFNLLFQGGIDALTGPIDVNAADFKLLGCEYQDVTGQCTDFLVADANADRLLIDTFNFFGAAAAGGASAIVLTGMDNPIIRNFLIIGNFTAAAIECRTTAVVDLEVYNGYIWTKNSADLCIRDLITGSTGRVGPDLQLRVTDNAANITASVTGATFVVFDNVYVVNLAGEKAMLIDWTASTNA